MTPPRLVLFASLFLLAACVKPARVEVPETSDVVSTRVERVEPTPEPEPLPDPEQSECPEATRVGNRVCEHLTEPGGVLACRAGDEECHRRCRITRISDDATGCGPDGFALVEVWGRNLDQFMVYVDGPRVWLGPEVEKMYAEDSVELRGGVPNVLEQHESRDEETSDWSFQRDATTLIFCALVDGHPRCSSPILQALQHEDIQTDISDERFGEVISHEEITYEADVTVTPTSVKVDVREGKRHVNSTHLAVDGLRVLASGNYELRALLDQPFVELGQ